MSKQGSSVRHDSEGEVFFFFFFFFFFVAIGKNLRTKSRYRILVSEASVIGPLNESTFEAVTPLARELPANTC